MSNQCKCINPDGGGTTCPPQHVALCIRGNDRHCYGTCSPIPGVHRSETRDFGRWLQDNIYMLVDQYAQINFAYQYSREFLSESASSRLPLGGTKIFSLGQIKIAVRYSIEFTEDNEAGAQYSYA